MNGLAILLLLSACVVGGSADTRALWQLSKMIVCTSTEPKVDPLKYNDYGCYCGFGGQGTPVDEVDKCCQIHDNCYGTYQKTPGCESIIYSPYILIYNYSCSDKQVTCSNTNGKCQAAVCACDRALAQCFAQNDKLYNPANKNLNSKERCIHSR